MSVRPHAPIGLDTWFPHKVCMNLDRRPERWARMKTRLAAHGITNVERFSAVDGDRVQAPPGWQGSAGAYGCLRSNLAVVEDARRRGWSSVMVLEDDVVFDDELNVKLPRFMAQLPPDWDMLFLGAMHRGAPVRIREHVLKLTASTATYCYAVRHRVYAAFQELHSDARVPIDVSNRALQERFNCYCFFPHLAWVEAEFSDTYGRPVNPWWLRESLILAGAEVDDIQKRTLVIIPYEPGPRQDIARRNLTFTVGAYRRLLQDAAVVVVEQGRTLDRASIPESCEQMSLTDDRPFNRARCFNEAIGSLGRNKGFYACAERDIVPGWDVIAQLLKCRHYDAASSCRQVMDLTAEDAARVANHELIDGSSYTLRPRRGLYVEGCVVTAEAFRRGGGWDETAEERGISLQARRGADAWSVFDSPSIGSRLFAGVGEGGI